MFIRFRTVSSHAWTFGKWIRIRPSGGQVEACVRKALPARQQDHQTDDRAVQNVKVLAGFLMQKRGTGMNVFRIFLIGSLLLLRAAGNDARAQPASPPVLTIDD